LKKVHLKTVVVIAGPTAIGKTAVAIGVAQHFNTQIISADSRQCFKELDIGVARPSSGELKTVPHHFIASHSIRDVLTAATFEQFALETATGLFRDHDLIVMTGGTGLYIKAFCEGLDTIPGVDPVIREKIIRCYNEQGLSWLQQEIKLKDPVFAMKGEMQNPQRIMRALEVVEGTGRSICSFRTATAKTRPFSIIKIGLEASADELKRRIDRRVDQMIDAGLVKEVESLLNYKNLNALQTVGYAEIIDYLENKTSLEEAIALIKTHTRQYAKRQMTWFKKDKSFSWFMPGDLSSIISFIEDAVR
jgi:tRNA dimethylallyltransferase